jgi:hypothetical protein
MACKFRNKKIKLQWVEAFYKFGFDDGDGKVETGRIVRFLTEAGFRAKTFKWQPHNTIIVSIQKDGIEYIPSKIADYRIGYHSPREYLSAYLIEMLDTAFPPTSDFVFPYRL